MAPAEEGTVRECINKLLRQDCVDEFRKDPIMPDLPYA